MLLGPWYHQTSSSTAGWTSQIMLPQLSSSTFVRLLLSLRCIWYPSGHLILLFMISSLLQLFNYVCVYLTLVILLVPYILLISALVAHAYSRSLCGIYTCLQCVPISRTHYIILCKLYYALHLEQTLLILVDGPGLSFPLLWLF